MKFLLTTALAIVFGGLSSAQVSIAFDAEDPPFMYAKDSQPAGLYPAIFKAAFVRMGVAANQQSLPWKRALAGIDTGSIGVGGIYQNTDRLAKYDFSQAYFEERLAIFCFKGKEIAFTKLDDLYGKMVGVISGWSYGDDFDAAVKAGKIKVDPTDGDESNITKLVHGRLDAVLAIVESGDAAIKAQGVSDKVVRLPNLMTVNKVYLAFNKSADEKALLSDFDKAIAAMKSDGSFDKIVAESFK